MKKLLIISVSAGAGHVRIAQAVEQTARLSYPDLDVEHIDMMDFVVAPVRAAIVETYDQLVRRMPSLWGYLYDVSDSADRLDKIEAIIRMINQVNARKLYDVVQDYAPDHIICTHSFPAQALAQSNALQDIPLSVIVTDYGLHSYWLLGKPDTFFVGAPRVKHALMHEGVDEENIHVTGLPVLPIFFEEKDTLALRKQYRLPVDKKIILVLSGGQGFMKGDMVVQKILGCHLEESPHIIAIAGKNEELYASLQQLADAHPTVHAVGWTDAMDEYMRMADVIIGKPGGSTVSEVMALGKPFIAVHPIPGQEEQNALFLEQNQKGHVAQSDIDLYESIQAALHKEGSDDPMKENPAETILKHLNYGT